ncbi:unnamed protein product [Haemonchus placei]|uniref:Protein archease n=1 Tax=Haemonchus placei TaxID=6290 RepID=A0A0N4X9B7_HAEPC|nr:unnamed protein product [Haemonchus placei]
MFLPRYWPPWLMDEKVDQHADEQEVIYDRDMVYEEMQQIGDKFAMKYTAYDVGCEEIIVVFAGFVPYKEHSLYPSVATKFIPLRGIDTFKCFRVRLLIKKWYRMEAILHLLFSRKMSASSG